VSQSSGCREVLPVSHLSRFLVLALLAIYGCSSDGTAPSEEGSPSQTGAVSVAVRVSSAALSGVTVELSGSAAFRSGVTGGDGLTTFVELPAGSYSVSISGHPGDLQFDATTKSITVTSGSTTNVAFEASLIQSASIAGVLSAWNKPVSGATVELSGQVSDSRVTTAEGSFTFTGLRSGTYTIQATGYDEAQYLFEDALEIVVETGQATSVVLSGAITLPWTGVATSHETTCGLIAEDVFCWGNGRFGALGDGRTGNPLVQATPKWIPDLSARVVRAARFTFCAVKPSNEAWCWGQGGYGSLGSGGFDDQLVPSIVQGNLNFADLSVGGTHTCGISVSGTTYCWGWGGLGQLGNGGTTGRTVPEPVATNVEFVSAVTGISHACGLDADGLAYCWGRGHSGETGSGVGAEEVLTPTLVLGGLRFSQITAGGNSTCAVAMDGQGYCWGIGGALGSGTEDRFEPTLIAGGHEWGRIEAGGAHTCGLTLDGRAFCWGSNGTTGSLGIGVVAAQSSRPEPAEVSGGLLFSDIDIWNHTCAVSTSGRLYCWGANGAGQIGNGDSGSGAVASVPTPVG
jgi:alpha-tubulin suppressor-like RCC1 family protein